MNFILYSAVNASNIGKSLGLPEYSYYFVLKEFRIVMERIANVVVVESESEVPSWVDKFKSQGEECVYVSFTPPQNAVIVRGCPTIIVFAWEFDNIPNETWDTDNRNDWNTIFQNCQGVIPLSTHTAEVLSKSLGNSIKIQAIPVPVWDRFGDLTSKNQRDRDKSIEIELTGNLVDSNSYEITPDKFVFNNAINKFEFDQWTGEELLMQYTIDDDYNSFMGGFYPAESWGAWSKIEEPWIIIPVLLQGEINLAIECAGYGHNANREIKIALGDQQQTLCLSPEFKEQNVSFKLSGVANLLKFSGIAAAAVPDSYDPRSMGVGIKSIKIHSVKSDCLTTLINISRSSKTLCLSGVVYTSVFNPIDERKNWLDIVSAFCYSFRNVEDATLVLKMTHNSLASFLGRLHYLLQLLAPFKCRVIAIHGFLEKADYSKLIEATDYYVNASRCEGLCLPLMEFMASGKPAIAPKNTAMLDYVDADSTFIVNSDIEPAMWPHDPRDLLRTTRHRIEWESLAQGFEKSYNVAKFDHQKNEYMSNNASKRIKEFSSNQVVEKKLREFFCV